MIGKIDVKELMTNPIAIGVAAFLAGHIVQEKVDTLGKIGDVIGMVPIIGDTLEKVWDFVL